MTPPRATLSDDAAPILWEGPCAYARSTSTGYEVIVYSTNAVNHVLAAATEQAERAERLCKRLNAHPRQARQSFGLL